MSNDTLNDDQESAMVDDRKQPFTDPLLDTAMATKTLIKQVLDPSTDDATDSTGDAGTNTIRQKKQRMDQPVPACCTCTCHSTCQRPASAYEAKGCSCRTYGDKCTNCVCFTKCMNQLTDLLPTSPWQHTMGTFFGPKMTEQDTSNTNNAPKKPPPMQMKAPNPHHKGGRKPPLKKPAPMAAKDPAALPAPANLPTPSAALVAVDPLTDSSPPVVPPTATALVPAPSTQTSTSVLAHAKAPGIPALAGASRMEATTAQAPGVPAPAG